MQKSTQELMHRLKRADNIQEFLDENEKELLQETIHGFLIGLLTEKGIRVAEVAYRSGQGDYVYKVFQGKRKASRDILLAIAIGMKLTIHETQLLLRIAQTAQLDPRNRRDSVLIYALNNGMTIETINNILFDVEEATL